MAETQADVNAPLDVEINIYIRQEGEDFVGGGHFPSYEDAHYLHRVLHINCPTFIGIDAKDFPDAENYDSADLEGEDFRDYFGIDDSSAGSIPSMKIPVLAEGLNWTLYSGPDPDPDTNPQLVANAKDSFISLPYLGFGFHYIFYKGQINTEDLGDADGDDNVDPGYYEGHGSYDEDGYYHVGSEDEDYDIYNIPHRASFGLVGTPDNKNQFHETEPVLWVRVDDSYAKAHPKEVRKQGYFYYKQDDISVNPQVFGDNPLQTIYSVDDAEYKFDMDDLKEFKDAIDDFVNENYGGYDVPLNIPLVFKWPRYEHKGDNYALNVFVHPKGVL